MNVDAGYFKISVGFLLER